MPPRAKLLPVRAPGESRDGEWRVWVSAKDSETGKKYRVYFPTKAAAEQFAKETRARLAEYGDAARHMTGEERLEAYRCLLIAQEHGFTLTGAVELMRARTIQAKRSLALPTLVREYLAYLAAKGPSPDYLKDSRINLTRFADAHPFLLASDVTTDLIKTYLDGLSAPRTNRTNGREYPGLRSAVSWNNHRRLISVLLNYAARHQPPYVSANVCEHLEEKRTEDKEVEVFTTDEARRLLDCASGVDRRLIPVVAIGLFAGVRPDECRRLTWDEIHWPEGEQHGDIEVKAAKAKDSRRRLIEIQPNLLAWLVPFRGQTGKVWPIGRRSYYEKMPALRAVAGVERIHDGFRHTFASNHLVRFNDIGRTTAEMGHRSTAMLFEHYRRVVKRSEAEAFFNIFPNNPLVGGVAPSDEDRVQH